MWKQFPLGPNEVYSLLFGFGLWKVDGMAIWHGLVAWVGDLGDMACVCGMVMVRWRGNIVWAGGVVMGR